MANDPPALDMAGLSEHQAMTEEWLIDEPDLGQKKLCSMLFAAGVYSTPRTCRSILLRLRSSHRGIRGRGLAEQEAIMNSLPEASPEDMERRLPELFSINAKEGRIGRQRLQRYFLDHQLRLSQQTSRILCAVLWEPLLECDGPASASIMEDLVEHESMLCERMKQNPEYGVAWSDLHLYVCLSCRDTAPENRYYQYTVSARWPQFWRARTWQFVDYLDGPE